MKQDDINILCTRPLPAFLIDDAKMIGIAIDELSFIDTAPFNDLEVTAVIENILTQTATIVFTSMNAVDVVADKLAVKLADKLVGQLPDWKIYCIGTTTNHLVKKYFGESAIAGTAFNAAALANLIAADRFIDEVTFFCGDQRRDELPEILRKNNIDVNEVVVYHTITTAVKINKDYQGILFFSPSAVASFFSVNQLPTSTVLFAIGDTTAAALKEFSTNKIITSDQPGKENLVKKMMEYYAA